MTIKLVSDSQVFEVQLLKKAYQQNIRMPCSDDTSVSGGDGQGGLCLVQGNREKILN